ncbi:unnamed protein product, partial [Staurois parvus]
TLHLAQCSQASTVLLCSRVCCTPLHPTLCIALGDVRLGCSCSAMEKHPMKLSTHCCCANLKPNEVWRSLAIDSADRWQLLRTACFSMC